MTPFLTPPSGDACPAPPAALCPTEVEEEASVSHFHLTFDGVGGVTLWGERGAARPGEHAAETRVTLHGGKPMVVGRANGGEVPYLDPSYVPTSLLPDTGQSVLTGAGDGQDQCVSRGHFLLRAAPGGVVLVNGVPARGGGIRPPRNGTQLVHPQYRWLQPAEEVFIPDGKSASVTLPNGVTVRILAG